MTRVLAIDHWTGGVLNFQRLLRTAGPSELTIMLLHTGSLRDRNNRRVQELEGVLCVDIAAYRGLSLRGAIEQLDPDVVLMLNIHTLLERAVIHICRSLGVPTVFLQHGVYPELDVFREQCEMHDGELSLPRFLKLIPRHGRLLMWYMQARPRTFGFGLIKLVWYQVTRPRVATFFPASPEELRPDLALVFSPADAERFVSTHGLTRDRMRVVGNPELDAAFAYAARPVPHLARSELRLSVGLEADRPVVFSLDEGYTETFVYGWTDRVRRERLEELRQACQSAGAQLLFRPRRASDEAIFRSMALGPGFAATRQLSVVDSIALADCVVGTLSSVLETAVILAKPILVPLWHIQNRANDSPYLRAGVGVAVAREEDLTKQLAIAIQSRESPRFSEYMTSRLGRTNPGSCDDIVNEIIALARANHI